MLSPEAKNDKAIRSTDMEALSCRASCNSIGYFVPSDQFLPSMIQSYGKYLQFCDGYTNLSAGRAVRSLDKKFPIINRGTYLRTEAITKVIHQFCTQFPDGQIISLGGGSDTRCFNYDVKYVEIDFPETTKIKKLAIASDPKMSAALGHKGNNIKAPESRDEFKALDSDLHTDTYHLIGYDLRKLDGDVVPSWWKYIDASAPTLVLSECVLCYSNPQENKNIINFWSKRLDKMGIVIYEPISLNDSFGERMLENLGNRGINMLTLNEYPTLSSKKSFLHDLGLSNVKVTDIAEVGGYGKTPDTTKAWFDGKEVARINRLELIDEVEEIRLLLRHYCLIYGENQLGFTAIDSFAWYL